MGSDQSSSRSGTAVGLLIILSGIGATVYGGVRFVLAVRDERSPAVLAWIAMGLLLFFVGMLVALAIVGPFRPDEDTITAVGAVLGLVLVVAGLGGTYYWVHVREPALVTALGAACRGDGVAAAPAPAGERRVVVLDDRGHKTDWTTRDAIWRAEKASEADLVACIERTEENLETCNYRPVTGGPTTRVDRFEEVLAVRVVEARTAEALGRFELRGTPRACKRVEEQGQGDLHGQVTFAAFEKALAPYRG